MNALIDDILKYVNLSAASKKELLVCSQIEHYSKNEQIIDSRKKNPNMYFLVNGVVRSFQYRNDREITTWLYHPTTYFAAWDSLLFNRKNDEIFECETNVELISINHNKLQELHNKYPPLAHWSRKLAEHYVIFFNDFNKNMRFSSANEKYEYYLNQFPKEPKVKLGHVASFLGITQETLSRTRK